MVTPRAGASIPRRWPGRAAPLALAAAALLGPAPAEARDATTTFSADAIGRYGPLGITVAAGAARRWPWDDGHSPLARGRYAQAGATLWASPAYAQATLAAELVPVAPLQLRLQYDAYGFFGAFGALLRFPSADSRFGTEQIRALRGDERTGIGHRLTSVAVLRARLGRLVARSDTDLHWYALSGSRGWYYESEYDTLLAGSDWLVANRTALLVELWRGAGDATLLAGPMYDVTRAGGARIVRQRAGGTAYWVPAARWLGIDRPRIYALAGVNLSDRNREGEPFAVVGVGGDLDVRGR